MVEVRGLPSRPKGDSGDPGRGASTTNSSAALRASFLRPSALASKLATPPDTKMPPPYGAEALLFVVGGGDESSIEHLTALLTLIQRIKH